MQNCLAMIGNSSSGIVEAASFNIPVINIGTRQDGKFKPKNIIDCKYSWKDIYNKIEYSRSKGLYIPLFFFRDLDLNNTVSFSLNTNFELLIK